jgi:retinol dehydrogenase-14
MGGAEGDEASVAGKTCVVTGANSGIGLEVARALARGGARVVLACRSRSKAANAAKDIISSTGNVNVECRALDLANLASVREFAEGFNGPEEVVDILVNNAGAMFKDHGVTDEGRERTWQTNALAPHYLARLMMPALARAAAAQGNTPGSARYVYVTSKLETKGVVAGELRSGTPEARMFNAIADKTKFDTFKRYATAKQAGTALTFELGRRVKSAPRGAGDRGALRVPGDGQHQPRTVRGRRVRVGGAASMGAHEDVHSRSGAGVVRGAIEVTGGC